MYRTHTCGELTAKEAKKTVTLAGWANKVRNLGGMTFIDLRDRYGITQVTYDPAKCNFPLPEIKSEYVVQITGEVVARPKEMVNKDMITGEVELHPTTITVLSTCKELPFSIDHENPVGEDIRLEYRYLDLRRQSTKENIIMRHKLYVETMKFFDEQGFLHVETPTFVKNTPEGSREYVVPARFDPGKFFVLPQSPQQLKQMLMVAGIDKYFQLARCYRDEDPRGDRQPEFTQIDVEMSFITQEEILKVLHEYSVYVTKKLYPKKTILNDPFPTLTWFEAMNTFGSDKPELRTRDFGFVDCTTWAHASDFSVFKNAECVKTIVIHKEMGRSEIEKNYEALIKQYGSKGLAYLTLSSEGVKGSIAKFFTPEQIEELKKLTGAKEGDTLFFQADSWENVVTWLGMLRNKLIADFELLKEKKDEISFGFIVDFPLFEVGSDGGLGAVHHPFTKPKDEDIPFVKELGNKIKNGGKMTEEEKKKLLTIKADCYDIIMNGNEAGGGSIRIHDRELQYAIFAILGLTDAQINNRFGHLLRCFEYGGPPHGGFALGFDRLVMIYQNMENLREVIAFPKNQKYRDLMLNAPSEVDQELLDELGLKVIEKK